MFGPLFSRVIVCTALERSGLFDGRPRGAVAQCLVDPWSDAGGSARPRAVEDGDAGVLADQVALGVGDRDVAVDRLEHALTWDGGLALRCGRKRVAQILGISLSAQT